MTVLDALPRDDEGFIVLEGAAVISRDGEEVRIDAFTTDDALIAMYGEIIEAQVPLSQERYESLVAASSPAWKEQWQRWRSEGRI